MTLLVFHIWWCSLLGIALTAAPESGLTPALTQVTPELALRVQLRSEGCDSRDKLGCHRCGWAFILINGHDYSHHERGFDVVVLHHNGSFTSASFDTYGDKQASGKLSTFIDNVLPGEIVFVTVQDSALRPFKRLTTDAKNALRTVGANDVEKLQHRQSYALIGYKGSPRPPWSREGRKGRYNTSTVIDAVVPYNSSLAVPSPTVGPLSPYQSLGCFKDSRQISSLEGQDAILDVCFKARTNAIDKCAAAAAKRDFRVFGLQNGGKCLSDSTANATFNISGPSSDCKGDGEGGPVANQIYIFSEVSIPPTRLPNTTTTEVGVSPTRVSNTTKLTTEASVPLVTIPDVRTTEFVSATATPETFPATADPAARKKETIDEKSADHTLLAWLIPFVVVLSVIVLVIICIFIWRRKKTRQSQSSEMRPFKVNPMKEDPIQYTTSM